MVNYQQKEVMTRNTIIEGDCVQVMNDSIEENSVQLIFADPPYNLSGRTLNLTNNQTGGSFYKVNEKWDTFTQNDYIRFTHDWMQAGLRVLKDNGSLYISCTQHNIAEVLTTGKELGFKLNNVLTWYKSNAMPNITKRTFTHSTEFVCWFVKGKNWIFNYDEVKQINPHRTKSGELKQMRDFFDFIELPIVQGKERVRGEDGRALHPTQKPEKLIELIIVASSHKHDLVLDPFFGTGTTGYVAKKMQRDWIGIELNPSYIEIANKRLNWIQEYA